MKLKNKLKNKLNKKLNNKLVSLLLIIMVTLTAVFIASCAEKATTGGGTTGGGGSITDGGGGGTSGNAIEPCIPDAPAANSFVSKWDVSIAAGATGSGDKTIKLPLVAADRGGSYNFTVDWGDCTPDETVDSAILALAVADAPNITHTYTADAIRTNAAAATTATATKAAAAEAANKAKKAAEDVVTAAAGATAATSDADAIVTAAEAIVAVAAGSIDGSVAGSTAAAVKAANAAVADAEVAKGNIDTITAPTGSPGIAAAVNDSKAKAAIAVTAVKDAAKAVNAAANAADADASTTTFTVTITGNTGGTRDIKGWMFGDGGTASGGGGNGPSDALKLTEISSFGRLNLGSAPGYQFYGAENLTITANAGTPDLTSTIYLNNAFANATHFNSDISGWNVSTVTAVSYMFQNAKAFNNGGVSLGDDPATTSITEGWDVSKVTDMSSMFEGATNFNNGSGPGVSAKTFTWDANVAKVAEAGSMFKYAESFNQDISDWTIGMDGNVSTINMRAMFQGAKAFDQPIGKWNVSKVDSMYNMFMGASKFNQDISGWDVSAVLTMNNMFNGAKLFNQDLKPWDTYLDNSNLPTCGGIFSGANAMEPGNKPTKLSIATSGSTAGCY